MYAIRSYYVAVEGEEVLILAGHLVLADHLLRGQPHRHEDLRPPLDDLGIVITSYSIHYTKLYEEVLVCKPCAEARGITENMLLKNCRVGGMNDFYQHASRDDSKVVSF